MDLIDEEILHLCKQGRKLEAVKLRKDTSGEGLATAKNYVENLCEENGLAGMWESNTSPTSAKCFVITATMGDEKHPIVHEFRTFRDEKLLTNKLGRAFVEFYYIVGPFAATIISKSELLRKMSFSIFVHPIYKRLKKDKI